MTKKIIIILCIVAAVIAVTGFCMVAFLGQPEADPYLLERQLFGAYTPDMVQICVENNELKQGEGTSHTIVYDVPIFGQVAQFNYRFDEEMLLAIDTYVILNQITWEDGNYTVGELSGAIVKKNFRSCLENLCRMHGVELNNRFYIIEGSTQLDIGSDATYERLLTGDAVSMFTLKDVDGYFWTVEVIAMDDGIAIMRIKKLCDPSDYANLIPQITVF